MATALVGDALVGDILVGDVGSAETQTITPVGLTSGNTIPTPDVDVEGYWNSNATGTPGLSVVAGVNNTFTKVVPAGPPPRNFYTGGWGAASAIDHQIYADNTDTAQVWWQGAAGVQHSDLVVQFLFKAEQPPPEDTYIFSAHTSVDDPYTGLFSIKITALGELQIRPNGFSTTNMVTYYSPLGSWCNGYWYKVAVYYDYQSQAFRVQVWDIESIEGGPWLFCDTIEDVDFTSSSEVMKSVAFGPSASYEEGGWVFYTSDHSWNTTGAPEDITPAPIYRTGVSVDTEPDLIGSPSVVVGETRDPVGVQASNIIGTVSVGVNETRTVVGVVSSNVIGDLSVVSNEFLTPTGVDSENVIGGVSVTQNETIVPSLVTEVDIIGDVEAFVAQTISPYGFIRDNLFGDISVNQTVSVEAVGNSNTIGDPTLNQVDYVSPELVAEEDVIGDAVYSLLHRVYPDGLTETDAIGNPIVNGVENVSPDIVTETDTVGDIAVNQIIYPNGLEHSNIIPGAGGLLVNPPGVYGFLIVSENVIGAPKIHRTLYPSAVISDNEFGVASAAALDPIEVTPEIVSDSDIIGVPTVNGYITVVAVESENVIGDVSVTQDEVTPVIGVMSVNAVGDVTVHQILFPQGVESDNEFGDPTPSITTHVYVPGFVNLNSFGSHAVYTDERTSVHAVISENIFGDVVLGQTVQVSAVVSINRIGAIYLDRDESEDFFFFFIAGY